MTRDKYRTLSAKECAEIILCVDNPVIIPHTHPDADAVGTTAALIEIFNQLGKRALYYLPDELACRLEFILTDCERADSLDGLTPITVDVASHSQLGKLAESIGEVRLMIDHHEIGTPFADSFIIPEASSASEVLFEIIDELRALGKIKLNKRLATALYTAISSDTGCFCYSNVTPKTHLRAAELIECGIDHADINHRLFHSKEITKLKAEGIAAREIKTAFGGRVAYFTLTKKMLVDDGLTLLDFDTSVDVVRSLSGVEIAIYIRELDGGYKASLRSTSANVAEVASAFGGGGHIRAAGCFIKADGIDEAVKALLDKINLD